MSEPTRDNEERRAGYAFKPTHLLAVAFVGLALAAAGCGQVGPTPANNNPPPACPLVATTNCIPPSSPPDQDSYKELLNRYETWRADHQSNLTFHDWRIEILR